MSYDLFRVKLLHEAWKRSIGRVNRKRAPSKAWLEDRWRKHHHEVPFYKEIEEQGPEKYYQTFRMTNDIFNLILSLIEDSIRKHDTDIKEAIPPKLRLQATLRHLVDRVSYSCLGE